MIFKFSFIALFLTYSATTFAQCKVTAPSDIVVSSKSSQRSIATSFTFKDCEQKNKNQFLAHINDFSGELHPRSVKLAYDVTIDKKVNIIRLEDFISKHINIKDNVFVKRASLVGPNNTHFIFQEFDELRLDCENCNSLGEHNAKLIHVNQKGTQSTYWITFKAMRKINALSSTYSQRVNHKSLNAKDFEWKVIFTEKPEEYFTSLGMLSFFKANRNLNEGEGLMRSHITPLFLVRAGDIANIKMKNGNIALRGKGVAIRAGKFGDIISLKNLKTQKIIMGKVIGKNTIEAQL